MTSSIYGIGTGALANAQAGVLTAGHNIANADTPGFSRQTVEIKANEAFFSGSGFVGTGPRSAPSREATTAIWSTTCASPTATRPRSRPI